MKTRGDLIRTLLMLPEEIDAAETALLAAQQNYSRLREMLGDDEAIVVLNPEGVPGKNAEERAARVRALTAGQRAAVREAEERRRSCESRLRVLRDRLTCFRAAAQLIGEEETDVDQAAKPLEHDVATR